MLSAHEVQHVLVIRPCVSQSCFLSCLQESEQGYILHFLLFIYRRKSYQCNMGLSSSGHIFHIIVVFFWFVYWYVIFPAVFSAVKEETWEMRKKSNNSALQTWWITSLLNQEDIILVLGKARDSTSLPV